MKYSKQFIDEFLGKFDTNHLKPKKKKPCRIKANGEYIAVSSGKTVWASKTDAKNAFSYHFSCGCVILDESSDEDLEIYKKKYKLRSRMATAAWNNFVDFLQKEGILEFVELD